MIMMMMMAIIVHHNDDHGDDHDVHLPAAGEGDELAENGCRLLDGLLSSEKNNIMLVMVTMMIVLFWWYQHDFMLEMFIIMMMIRRPHQHSKTGIPWVLDNCGDHLTWGTSWPCPVLEANWVRICVVERLNPGKSTLGRSWIRPCIREPEPPTPIIRIVT